MITDVRFKHPYSLFNRDLRGRASRHFACISTETQLSVPNVGSRDEFYGVSVNGPLFPPELDALNLNIRYHDGVAVDFKNPARWAVSIHIGWHAEQCVFQWTCVRSLYDGYNHHRNISFIFITQNIFHQSKHCRDISLNAKYLGLIKNVRDRRQFRDVVCSNVSESAH